MAMEGAWVAMHVWKMGMNKMDENGDGYDRWWVLQMVSWVKSEMVSMDDVESDGYEDKKKWSVQATLESTAPLVSKDEVSNHWHSRRLCPSPSIRLMQTTSKLRWGSPTPPTR
uniref:Uncharacterized protein n=1 Tax=Vitis vinifera TaxID=29760 RepID=A5BZ91_VITVI|nr:hypothetical protein VITISV_017887 [Vitis vinifera]